MAEQPLSNEPLDHSLQARIQELARFLRQAQHLGPEEQRTLAALVAELGRDLDPNALSSSQKTDLGESIALLTQALRQHHEPGLLEGATERLEGAVIRTANAAPVTTGVIRRLLDALANLGI